MTHGICVKMRGTAAENLKRMLELILIRPTHNQQYSKPKSTNAHALLVGTYAVRVEEGPIWYHCSSGWSGILYKEAIPFCKDSNNA